MKKIIPSRAGREWCRWRWWRALRLTMRGSHPAVKFRLTRRTTHAESSFFLLHLGRPRLPFNRRGLVPEVRWRSTRPSSPGLRPSPQSIDSSSCSFLSLTNAIAFDLGEDVWRFHWSPALGWRGAKAFAGRFLMASQALLRADKLITRDANRYVRDLPRLRLI